MYCRLHSVKSLLEAQTDEMRRDTRIHCLKLSDNNISICITFSAVRDVRHNLKYHHVKWGRMFYTDFLITGVIQVQNIRVYGPDFLSWCMALRNLTERPWVVNAATNKWSRKWRFLELSLIFHIGVGMLVRDRIEATSFCVGVTFTSSVILIIPYLT